MNPEYLHRMLHYNPDTGIFTWLCNKARAIKGEKAGSINGSGAVQIQIDSTKYLAHRLAFIYMEGICPPLVDHINGNRIDNRWCNLRKATKAQNMWNSKLSSKNTSGFKGVVQDKRTKRWEASIRKHGKRFHVGTFNTAEEANEAACNLREKLYGEFCNHGVNNESFNNIK